MANPTTIPAGQFLFSYYGTVNLPLSEQPWYTSANINMVFGINDSRKGYISGVPGSNFGITHLLAPAPGAPANGYVLNVKVPFQLDLELFGVAQVGGSLENSWFWDVAAGTVERPLVDGNYLESALQITRVVALNKQGADIACNVTIQLDNGLPLSIEDFNMATSEIPDGEFRNNAHRRIIEISIPSNVAGTVEIFYQ